MVKFGAYWESMVMHKPEWRRAFIDYPKLNAVIKKLKAEVKARARDPQSGQEVAQYNVFGETSADVEKAADEEDDSEVFHGGRHASTLRSPKHGAASTSQPQESTTPTGFGSSLPTVDAAGAGVAEQQPFLLQRRSAAASDLDPIASRQERLCSPQPASRQQPPARGSAPFGVSSATAAAAGTADDDRTSVTTDPLQPGPPRGTSSAIPIAGRQRSFRSGGAGRSGPHVFTPPESFMHRIGVSAAALSHQSSAHQIGPATESSGMFPPEPAAHSGSGSFSPSAATRGIAPQPQQQPQQQPQPSARGAAAVRAATAEAAAGPLGREPATGDFGESPAMTNPAAFFPTPLAGPAAPPPTGLFAALPTSGPFAAAATTNHDSITSATDGPSSPPQLATTRSVFNLSSTSAASPDNGARSSNGNANGSRRLPPRRLHPVLNSAPPEMAAVAAGDNDNDRMEGGGGGSLPPLFDSCRSAPQPGQPGVGSSPPAPILDITGTDDDGSSLPQQQQHKQQQSQLPTVNVRPPRGGGGGGSAQRRPLRPMAAAVPVSTTRSNMYPDGNSPSLQEEASAAMEPPAASSSSAVNERAPLLGGAKSEHLSAVRFRDDPNSKPMSPVSPAYSRGSGGDTGFSLEYLLSLEGRELAHNFERLLLKETERSTRWGQRAVRTFADYIDTNREHWASTKNIKKAKFAMRHVYEEVNHLHTFCDTNILTIKTALKKYSHAQPEGMGPEMNEEALCDPLLGMTADVEAVRRSLEVLYAQTFGGGDLKSGMHAIRSTVTTPHISTMQAFRAGGFFATLIAIILYWVHVYVELRPSPETIRHFNDSFPVFRLVCSVVFGVVVWAWVLRICATQRINYLYVFELPQTTTITWMVCLEFGLFISCLALLAGVLHLRLEINHPYADETNDYNPASPYALPVACLLVILLLAIPPRHVIRNTRDAFCRVFRRLVVLPFGYVRFIEFFVADWGTSMPQPLADLLYTVCFYTGSAKFAFGDESAWHECTDVVAKWQYPIVAIPYFWRACQTLKMFLRTKNRAHLVNHGKYQSFLIHFAVDWMFAFMEATPVTKFIRAFWHFVAELYAFVWDVLMDWGFIRGRKRERMFKRVSIYVAATIFDFFARFFYLWAQYWIAERVSDEWLVLFQALLEIFRRASWSIFRIENENVNNLETYRSIDFVPEVTLPDAEK